MLTFSPEVQEALMVSQDKFVWEAPFFERHPRGKGWYLWMSLAALFLVAYAVWTANFLFAFIILLMAILLVLAGGQEPKNILVQVGDNGVVWAGKLYLFQDIDSFSIVYQPPLAKVLYLEHRNPVMPRIRIELQEQDPLELRSHLRQYLREDLDLQSEHLSDIVSRLLRI